MAFALDTVRRRLNAIALSCRLAFARLARSKLVPLRGHKDVEVVADKRVAAFAMRLRAALYCRRLNHLVRYWSPGSLDEQSLFHGDTTTDALHKNILTNASLARPVLRNHAAPLVCDPHVRHSVSVLRGARRPHAILRGIVSVVVLSFKRVSARPWSHVRDEVTESLPAWRSDSPSVANRNAASTVPVIRLVLFVVAAFEHVPVHAVHRLVPHARSSVELDDPLYQQFRMEYCDAI